MKQTITEYQFVDAIEEDTGNNISFDGARALFEYIEDYEDQTGEETELDVVAIRCEWTEYANFDEALEEYNDIRTGAELRDHTIVIDIPNTDRVIIQEF
jgi:hypothetical protein